MPPPPPDYTVLILSLSISFGVFYSVLFALCFAFRKRLYNRFVTKRKAAKEDRQQKRLEKKQTEAEEKAQKEQMEKDRLEQQEADEKHMAALKAVRDEYDPLIPVYETRTRQRNALREEEETLSHASQERRRTIKSHAEQINRLGEEIKRLGAEEEAAVELEQTRIHERAAIRKRLRKEDAKDREAGVPDLHPIRQRLLAVMTEQERKEFMEQELKPPPKPFDAEAIRAEEAAEPPEPPPPPTEQELEAAAVMMQCFTRKHHAVSSANMLRHEKQIADAEAQAEAEAQQKAAENMLSTMIAGMFSRRWGADAPPEEEPEDEDLMPEWKAESVPKPAGPTLMQIWKRRRPTEVEKAAARTIQAGFRGMQARDKTRPDRYQLHVHNTLGIPDNVLKKAVDNTFVQEKTGSTSMLFRLEELAKHVRTALPGDHLRRRSHDRVPIRRGSRAPEPGRQIV